MWVLHCICSYRASILPPPLEPPLPAGARRDVEQITVSFFPFLRFVSFSAFCPLSSHALASTWPCSQYILCDCVISWLWYVLKYPIGFMLCFTTFSALAVVVFLCLLHDVNVRLPFEPWPIILSHCIQDTCCCCFPVIDCDFGLSYNFLFMSFVLCDYIVSTVFVSCGCTICDWLFIAYMICRLMYPLSVLLYRYRLLISFIMLISSVPISICSIDLFSLLYISTGKGKCSRSRCFV